MYGAIIHDRGYAKDIFSDFEVLSGEHFTELKFKTFSFQKENSFMFLWKNKK